MLGWVVGGVLATGLWFATRPKKRARKRSKTPPVVEPTKPLKPVKPPGKKEPPKTPSGEKRVAKFVLAFRADDYRDQQWAGYGWILWTTDGAVFWKVNAKYSDEWTQALDAEDAFGKVRESFPHRALRLAISIYVTPSLFPIAKKSSITDELAGVRQHEVMWAQLQIDPNFDQHDPYGTKPVQEADIVLERRTNADELIVGGVDGPEAYAAMIGWINLELLRLLLPLQLPYYPALVSMSTMEDP